MASIKASLKAISDAIRQQKWDDALSQAENVISRDANSYQAYVAHSAKGPSILE